MVVGTPTVVEVEVVGDPTEPAGPVVVVEAPGALVDADDAEPGTVVVVTGVVAVLPLGVVVVGAGEEGATAWRPM